jgi:hypothetical protein
MVHAEQAGVGWFAVPVGGMEDLPKAFPDPNTLIGETGEGYALPSDIQEMGLGPSKDVEFGMRGQVSVGNPGPLVISGNHEHWEPGLGHLQQTTEGLKRQGGWDP